MWQYVYLTNVNRRVNVSREPCLVTLLMPLTITQLWLYTIQSQDISLGTDTVRMDTLKDFPFIQRVVVNSKLIPVISSLCYVPGHI